MAQPWFSQPLFRLGAFASLAVLVAMSVVPGGSRPTIEIGGLLIGALGVIEHIIGYAVCACLFTLGFTRWRVALIFVCLAALAGGLELVQMLVPGRTPKVSDAVLSAVGAGLGICLAMWIRRQVYWAERYSN